MAGAVVKCWISEGQDPAQRLDEACGDHERAWVSLHETFAGAKKAAMSIVEQAGDYRPIELTLAIDFDNKAYVVNRTDGGAGAE